MTSRRASCSILAVSRCSRLSRSLFVARPAKPVRGVTWRSWPSRTRAFGIRLEWKARMEDALPTVTEHLRGRGVPFEEIPHERTYTSIDEARALGISADEVVKTIVLNTAAGHVLAVAPASQRLAMPLVRAAVGDSHARFATEEELERDFPGVELGGVRCGDPERLGEGAHRGPVPGRAHHQGAPHPAHRPGWRVTGARLALGLAHVSRGAAPRPRPG